MLRHISSLGNKLFHISYILLTVGLFVNWVATPTYPLPESAVAPPPTHLAFASYSEPMEAHTTPNPTNGQETTIWAYPLGADDLPIDSPVAIFSQPDPPDCQTNSLHASPHTHFLIIQYNCHHGLSLQLLNLESPTENPPLQTDSYFLSWSLDGEWFVYRQPDARAIYLTSATNNQAALLDLPPGTYDVVFAPDGQNLVYAASNGLGWGSEIGSLNLLTGEQTQWHQFPEQVVSYPRWSPDGNHLAYILMPDSNIPFLMGELWLADANGQPLTQLTQVDSGHGFAPVWSSDSTTISYIQRENPDSIEANHQPDALHSNIYQANIVTGEIIPLTQFIESRVEDISWTPDGKSLLFTANNTIWLYRGGEQPIQISPPGLSGHPVWLHLPTP